MRTHILLAEKRDEKHLDGKMLSRFSIKSKANEVSEIRFGCLQEFRETTLGAKYEDSLIFNTEVQLFILPLIGQIQVVNSMNTQIVDIGEAILLSVQPGDECRIINCYEHSDVHYIVSAFTSKEKVNGLARFSLNMDQFVTFGERISNQGLIRVSIGQWNGRSESVFAPASQKTFAWVVQGAFEIENCLVEKSDGLVISGMEKIEFEALSNDSIVIFMEMTSVVR